MCRICLGTSNSFILFNAKLDFTCQTVCELVNYVTNLDIEEEDQLHLLPQRVCQNCIEHLHIGFNLKRVAHESNNCLKDILKTSKTNTDLVVKQESIEEIEKVSDPLVKQEYIEEYYGSSFHSDNNLLVIKESETFFDFKKCTTRTTRTTSARRIAKERANESPEVKAFRLQKTARRAAERRANESPEQKTARNYREAKRIAQKRALEFGIESQDERAIRLEKIAKKTAERRANESPEQKTERNYREAKRIAQRRTFEQNKLKNR